MRIGVKEKQTQYPHKNQERQDVGVKPSKQARTRTTRIGVEPPPYLYEGHVLHRNNRHDIDLHPQQASSHILVEETLASSETKGWQDRGVQRQNHEQGLTMWFVSCMWSHVLPCVTRTEHCSSTYVCSRPRFRAAVCRRALFDNRREQSAL